MKCSKCEKEMEINDFYGKSFCYQCIYKEKTVSEQEKKKTRYCAICSGLVPKGKWVYCSVECLEIGAREKKRSYWSRRIKPVSDVLGLPKFNKFSYGSK